MHDRSDPFYPHSGSQHKCISCGGKKEIKHCIDCYICAEDYSYCYNCPIRNRKRIKERIEFDRQKAAIIRKELVKCFDFDNFC